MKTILRNAKIIPMTGEKRWMEGSVVFEDDVILSVGEEGKDQGEAKVIDVRGGIVVPGFVNAHTHVAMTLLRSFADGLPLQEWLFHHIFPVEAKLTDDDVYWGSMIGIMEMLSTGTTVFLDMYDHMEAIARAVEESGIKAALSRGVICQDDGVDFSTHPGTQENISMFQRYHGAADGRIKILFAPHAIYTNTSKSLQNISELALQYGAKMHIHLSETLTENEDCRKDHGMSPTQYLNSLDFFKVPTVAAHCVHLSEEDIAICKEKQVTLVHNPTSNLKLGSGIAAVRKWMDAGVGIALGTDGASSNNNLNMLEEVNLTGLIHNGAAMDSSLITGYDALGFATNASCLGFEDTGALQPGKKADITVFSADGPNFHPCNDPVSTLCFSAQGGDVSRVFVNGIELYSNGEFLTIDQEKVYYHAAKACNRLYGG